jgi:hypothetical protein
MQYRREFERKSVPRGTFLWNGNPQILVCVDIFFIWRYGMAGFFLHKPLILFYFGENIFFAHFNVGLCSCESSLCHKEDYFAAESF